MATKEIPVQEYELLLQESKGFHENQKDIHACMNVIKGVLNVFGLLDEKGNLKPEMSDSSKVIPPMLKSLGDVVGLMAKSQMPILGKKAEADLAAKFHFFSEIKPLVEKYAQNNQF